MKLIPDNNNMINLSLFFDSISSRGLQSLSNYFGRIFQPNEPHFLDLDRNFYRADHVLIVAVNFISVGERQRINSPFDFIFVILSFLSHARNK